MPSSDHDYFRARAAEERQRAATATNPNIRALHLELALRYEQLVSEISPTEVLQGSRSAIDRSMGLLKATSKQAERL